MTVYLNKDYEIYDSDGDASIKVCISDEMVRVHVADDEKSKEWFGTFDISVNQSTAKALAKAIAAMADDITTESF